jgi:hypothetical protein
MITQGRTPGAVLTPIPTMDTLTTGMGITGTFPRTLAGPSP